MKLREFPLLTDENIDPEVVARLRRLGFDVLDVVEGGLHGSADVDLLRLAAASGRIVVTPDADFGTLAIHQKEPLVGLVYLRPASRIRSVGDPHHGTIPACLLTRCFVD